MSDGPANRREAVAFGNAGACRNRVGNLFAAATSRGKIGAVSADSPPKRSCIDRTERSGSLALYDSHQQLIGMLVAVGSPLWRER